MYDYTTEVFSVGLEGLAPVDEDRLGEMAAEGWEPTLMTPVHNGFATLVLFRREGLGALKPAARRAPAAASASGGKKAAAAKKKAPPPGKAAKATPPGRGARAAAPAAGRVRRARPS